jgi:hypothetical protein
MWIVHRPQTLTGNEVRGGKTAAPPILSSISRATCSPRSAGLAPATVAAERARIYVDYKGNVWTAGGGNRDAAIKFTRDGKFLLQIGHKGKNGGSNDTENLGGAANMVDPTTNEIYVADGYVNHRVIVFDADTGAYKRHWGAYGKRPDDGYFRRPPAAVPAPSKRRPPAAAPAEAPQGAASKMRTPPALAPIPTCRARRSRNSASSRSQHLQRRTGVCRRPRQRSRPGL